MRVTVRTVGPRSGFTAGARALPGMFAMVDVVRAVSLVGFGRGNGVDTPPLEHAVREPLGPDGDDLVQPGLREPRRERFRALGEGVEERGGKHVAGHPADGIQMDVHTCDSTPVPATFRSIIVIRRPGPSTFMGDRKQMSVDRKKNLPRKAVLPLLAAMSILFAGIASALEPVFSTTFGGAIRGYDPVAYFAEGRPVAGTSDHRHEWMGAVWSFASAENRAAFEADPEKYAPRYGGYCAWAVSQGYTASIDPDAWRIVDGALYLNYSLGVQERWAKDVPGNIAKADVNWPRLRDE